MRLALLPCVLLFACVPGDADIDAGGPLPAMPPTEPTVPTPSPTLLQGTYATQFDAVTLDTCGGTFASGMGPTDWDLAWVDASTFEMVGLTDCTLVDGLVTCARQFDAMSVGPGATLTMETDRTGEPTDDETLELELTQSFACDGDCGAFEAEEDATFPCTVVLDTTSVRIGN